MLFFIGLNKVKKYQTAASFGMIPTCFGLNILGHLSFEEVIYASLIGNCCFFPNLLFLNSLII